MGFGFEKLWVYQSAQEFNLQIQMIYSQHRFDSHPVFNQASRAALSIPLNIAEGYGRFSKPEKCRFYRIALGSTYECVPLLEVLELTKAINPTSKQKFRSDLHEITGSLISLIKSHQNHS